MKILNEVYGAAGVVDLPDAVLADLCRVVELTRQDEQIVQMARSEQLRDTIVDQFVPVINLYDAALRAAFPNGASDAPADLWNVARIQLQLLLKESEYVRCIRNV